MAHTNLTNIPDLKLAICRATTIYVQPRFGTSEMWVKITKRDALKLANVFGSNSVTPNESRMACDIFGTIISGILYIG